MKIGMVGLGKMGLNLAENIKKHNHDVIGFDISEYVRTNAEKNNIATTQSLNSLISSFEEKRIIWVMLPSGKITEDTLEVLLGLLKKDDIVLDGGNSQYQNSVKWGELFLKKGIHFFDVGTSGGISGANNGACLMIGGEKDVFSEIEPLMKDLACEDGYLYCGKSGSGHYLKMVHNGMEYGMMQAIGEGFEILKKSDFDYDLEKVAKVFNHGSVVRSWLMELMESAFHKDSSLDKIKGIMQASGEAQWTIEEALKNKISTPVIALSLMVRYASQQEDSFAGKVVAALRNEFGGHEVTKK